MQGIEIKVGFRKNFYVLFRFHFGGSFVGAVI